MIQMILRFSGVARLKTFCVYNDVTVQPFHLPFFVYQSLQSFRMIGEKKISLGMRVIWRNRTPITPEKSPLKGGLWQPSFFKAIKQRQFRACKGMENAGQVVLHVSLACSCLFFTLLDRGRSRFHSH